MTGGQKVIKGILFDKDDTLIDLAAFWREPVHRLAKFLSRTCGQKEDEALIAALEAAAGFSAGKLIPDSPVVIGTNRDIMRACENVLTQEGYTTDAGLFQDGLTYLSYACILYGNVKYRTNFGPFLSTVRKKGIRIGIATSDDYAPTMHCLKRLAMDQYFDLVLSADCIAHPKPAPDMARIFCSQYELQPSEVLMIGDSENDMLFAKNSGMIGIYFTPDQNTECLPAGAAAAFHSAAELEKLIRSMNSNSLMT